LIDWLIMLMGVRPTLNCGHKRGLLFIPQVIYEYGEPWWDDNDGRGKLLARPPDALSQSYQHIHLRASRRNGWKEWGFCLVSISVHTCDFFTCHKTSQHGASDFTSHPKEGVLRILSPLKVYRLGQVCTCNPWFQWQTH
jgi:hypothetical protein